MNTSPKRAQLEYDNRLPFADDYSEAEAEWIANGVEQLMLGADITWQRRGKDHMSVSISDFYERVQCHLVDRQIAGDDTEDDFAKLVICAELGINCSSHSSALLGGVGVLEQLAEELLSPHAADGVAAMHEENEDDLAEECEL